MSNNLAIKLTNLSKKYLLHHQKPTLVENIFRSRKTEAIWALKDINLEIKKGEKIGVIGDNGSGKTTLLKIITGITSPTTGKIEINGRVAALIDLEAGFHPELTGEENIYLNGLLLGMSKREIKRKFRQIVDFSGLNRFIDTSFYAYSTGMKLRLGFSIAAHTESEILLLDENLSVGDQDFQKKSILKIQEFFKQGKTIVLVSHWLDFICKNCNRIVWMEKGKVQQDGGKGTVKQYQSKS